MASSPIPARHRLVNTRGALGALVVACGLAFVPLPAAAEPQPSTSGEAADLVAARARDLEVLTEQFNEAREELRATQEAAARATQELAAAEGALAGARDQVRAVAVSAYTGNRLGALQAMLTSDSPDELLDRIGTLRTIADHNNGALDAAEQATHEADRAKAVAQQVAVDAQSQVERVAAQQNDLHAQIATYQATYDRLNAEEQAASRAAAERHAAEQTAAAEAAAAADTGGTRSNGAPTPPAAVAATPPASAAPAAPPVPAPGGSAAADIAVNTAMAQLGDPYVWAAAGPDAFDCSGLVQYAYAAAGINLPHSSAMQSVMGAPITRSALQPGDLVFFYAPVSHVGIYIGNGQMVHASTAGVPVKVDSIDSMGSYNSARRIAG